MRSGVNPYKIKVDHQTAYVPKEVTVAVLVYIPHLAGYFEQKLEILKLVIGSLVEHTDVPYDLMVFDNGSCTQVVDYLLELRAKGIIQYLVLSKENLGVLGAYNVIFSAAPGRYIAYSDDDILFFPNWLSATLEIVNAFPQAGVVSSLPSWGNFGKSTAGTIAAAKQDPAVVMTASKGWPLDWAQDYAESISWDVDAFVRLCEDKEVISLERENVKAFATCTHCQFVARKEAACMVLPIDTNGKAMDGVPGFDERLDNAGFMRLSTVRPYVRHIGNRLPKSTVELGSQRSLASIGRKEHDVSSLRGSFMWLLRRGKVQRLLKKLYAALFTLVTISEGKFGESR